MLERTVRVLVVDDNSLRRSVLSDVLAEIAQVEAVGTAGSGPIAVAKLESLKPDIITLDFEMPETDRLVLLNKLKETGSKTSVVMVSSLSREGAKVTMKALELGAFAFLTRPKLSDPREGKDSLLSQLKPIISAFIVSKLLAIRKEIAGQEISEPPTVAGTSVSHRQVSFPEANTPIPPAGDIQIVAIGISTGGPNALAQVIPLLPEHFRVPVVVVQHMPPEFTRVLAESLHSKSRLSVVEGADGMQLAPGTVFIAPGGKQMKIVRQGGIMRLRITDDPPENHCKPSADYLFRSIADLYGKKALGVIMTGMGSDGVAGLKMMKKMGACVLAQDETSCVVFGMPFEAMREGIVDVVCSLSGMAEEIVKRVN